MSNTPSTPDRERFICTDGLGHSIGQRYDERRGVGNGPQICLRCKRTLTELVQARETAARIDEKKHAQHLIHDLETDGMVVDELQDEIDELSHKTNGGQDGRS
jgi:hypothetical protein